MPIDWDCIQELGKVPDVELAKRLGVTSSAVGKARKRRGLDRLMPAYIDWEAQPLGKVPDIELARRLGVSNAAVNSARRARAIPNALGEPKRVDWDAVPLLGKVTDEAIARQLGTAVSSVGEARRKRGIPAVGRGLNYVTQCGKLANYPEAVIDLVLHEKGCAHEFQARLGQYRVDWLFPDRRVVWEYAGWTDHPRFGHEYDRRMQRKAEWLTAQGYSVITFEPNELEGFEDRLDLGRLSRRNHAACINCGASGKARPAFGKCRRCHDYERKHGKPADKANAKVIPKRGEPCPTCPGRIETRSGVCKECHRENYLLAYGRRKGNEWYVVAGPGVRILVRNLQEFSRANRQASYESLRRGGTHPWQTRVATQAEVTAWVGEKFDGYVAKMQRKRATRCIRRDEEMKQATSVGVEK